MRQRCSSMKHGCSSVKQSTKSDCASGISRTKSYGSSASLKRTAPPQRNLHSNPGQDTTAHRRDPGTHKPLWQIPYRASPEVQAKVKMKYEEMLQMAVLRKSSISPTTRFCEAYRMPDDIPVTVASGVMNATREASWRFDGSGNVTFTDPSHELLGYILDASSVILLCIIMMSFGCMMQLSELKRYILRPKELVIAVCAQYGIMPLSAFSLSHAFKLSAIESLAILICGCCPGGNLSNIFTLAAKGDMNLSVLMTFTSTVLALGVMPLLLYIYCLGMDLGPMYGRVPFIKIGISLLIVILPCCAGILLNSKRPQYSKYFTKVRKSILGIPFAIGLIVMSAFYLKGDIFKIFSPWLMGAAALLPLTGYVLGYAVTVPFKVQASTRRTICMEIGCQNVQLCNAILKVTFDADIIGPYFLFPLLYLIFQATLGLLFILLFRLYDRKKASAEVPIVPITIYQITEDCWIDCSQILKVVEQCQPGRIEGVHGA
ncbi:hepatic sodium/bile acid cotransporter-like [Hyperolius riggenbachi]|uniref:hepatic sodium/bile acid cotransporter-like n=1 Tax=Hyperolius riggenbachi TaxID=752182 RepID=UPI0035A26CE5